ncbi:MAG TPA: methylmalonyl-CoA mutase family protein [Anaerolineales bacterium]|nr:methylmalonyl-CoA mutase family protein [Anaerolineales bacterium]
MDPSTLYQQWRENVYKKAVSKLPERKESFKTSSGLELPAILFDPNDPNYSDKLGFPGEFPFTRGVQPSMYRGKFWTMRQYSGYSTAEETNKRFRYLLEAGQTGLSVAFDLPTQIGYDADDEIALGEVGKVGVSISSIEDMERLLFNIPLDKVSTSMTINAPAGVLFAMYIAVAQKRGIETSKLRGTIQNDILKEYIARGTYIYPPAESMRLITDIFKFATVQVPAWNTISISGYHIREAGATAAQEIAFTIANAIAYVEAALKAGLTIDAFAGQLSFFFNAHNQLFEEIAKFRAARRLWAKVVKERFNAINPASMQMRFHTQTAGSTLTAQQPENNIARVTLQALSAVLGGTQSLHTNSMDEALWLPTEKSVQVALRTQQIIAYESGVADSVDPLAGSYLIEHLTDRLEEKALEYLFEIDRLGGALRAIELGFTQSEIQNAAYQAQLEIENGKSIIVGLNKFQTNEKITLEKSSMDPAVEKQARLRLMKLRAERDQSKVNSLRAILYTASKTDQNLMPIFIECVSNKVTLGEICNTLRDSWGIYNNSSNI